MLERTFEPYNEELVVLKTFMEGRDAELLFRKDHTPTLPLRECGHLWHMGWDIPTVWAVDAEQKAWMDGAHGGPLLPVSPHKLLSSVEDERARPSFYAHLGIEPPPSKEELLLQKFKCAMALGIEEAKAAHGVTPAAFVEVLQFLNRLTLEDLG